MREPAYRENVKFVIARRFGYLPEARIYDATLRDAGIRSFLSNTNTSQLLPFMDGGITLHVPDHQMEQAREIMAILDEEAARPPFDEDYRDADHDDIEFARLISRREEMLNSGPGQRTLLIVLSIAAIGALVYAIMMGYRYF